MSLDILKTQKLYGHFCSVEAHLPCPGAELLGKGCGAGGNGEEWARAAWHQALGARLSFPPRASWRLAGPGGLQGEVYCSGLAEALASPAHTGQDIPAGIS